MPFPEHPRGTRETAGSTTEWGARALLTPPGHTGVGGGSAHSRGEQGAHGYTTHTHKMNFHCRPCRPGRRGAGMCPRTHRQHRRHRRTPAPAAHIQVAAAWLPHRHVVSPPPVSSAEEKQTGSNPLLALVWAAQRAVPPFPGQLHIHRQPPRAAQAGAPCPGSLPYAGHWESRAGSSPSEAPRHPRIVYSYKFASPEKHTAVGKRNKIIRPALRCSESSP